MTDNGHVNLKARFLPGPSAWGWDLLDRDGQVVRSSWTDDWIAYASPAEALHAGASQLLRNGHATRVALMPRRGASAASPRLARLLIIVGRENLGLFQSLQASFCKNPWTRVLVDRRGAERRRNETGPTLWRRRRTRRARPEVDARIRACGWSMVDLKCSLAGSTASGASASPTARAT
jgi:hypothetical protein